MSANAATRSPRRPGWVFMVAKLIRPAIGIPLPRPPPRRDGEPGTVAHARLSAVVRMCATLRSPFLSQWYRPDSPLHRATCRAQPPEGRMALDPGTSTTGGIVVDDDGAARYTVISSDCHGGGAVADYRPYL